MYWSMPKVSGHHVIIAPHATVLSCMWIIPGQHAPFYLAAWQEYPCLNFQIGRGIIFNTTWVASCIIDFLQRYCLKDAYISFVLDKTSVDQDFLYVDIHKEHELCLYSMQKNMRHKSLHAAEYLYTTENYEQVYYWYAIPFHLIFQYQCIAIAHALNCIRITPRFFALLYAYQAVQAKAFRSSQLGLDLCKYNNRISHYFTKELVSRLITVPEKSLLSQKHTIIDVVAGCGIVSLYQGGR